jgi:hypothetical protein
MGPPEVAERRPPPGGTALQNATHLATDRLATDRLGRYQDTPRDGLDASDAAHFMEDHAYELIIAGWPIFPLRGKVPLIAKKDGGNGHIDATLDDRQVAEYWSKHPDANIGCRPPKWMIVIDIDPRAGGSLQLLIAAVPDLPPTLRSWSGRDDGGMHLFYARGDLGPIDRSRLPRGVDVKDHDGYVVLPPSVHPVTGKRYRWDEPVRPIAALSDGLRELLTPRKTVSQHRADWPGVDHPRINKRLAGMLHTVANARAEDHNRNNILNDLAYKAVTELGVGNEIAVRDLFTEAGRQAGLGESEIESTLKSAGFR